MARIDLESIERIGKERNSIHEKVLATYTVFDSDNGDRYVQIDTYERSNRVQPEKISQSFQIDEATAKFLVKLLIREFNLLK